MHDLVAIAVLAAACGGWVALQRWIARVDPEIPGIQRSCSGCSVPGAGGEACGGCTGGPGVGPDGAVVKLGKSRPERGLPRS